MALHRNIHDEIFVTLQIFNKRRLAAVRIRSGVRVLKHAPIPRHVGNPFGMPSI
jgi:hypothetical protein